MGNKKRKNKTTKESEHLGACVLYCKKCDYEFEMDWVTIFDIQEVTHGYVDMHLNDLYISCPKCDEIISEESDIIPSLHDTKNTKQNKNPMDD
jgi:formylmethanofuran dehydrogenase subunit E